MKNAEFDELNTRNGKDATAPQSLHPQVPHACMIAMLSNHAKPLCTKVRQQKKVAQHEGRRLLRASSC